MRVPAYLCRVGMDKADSPGEVICASEEIHSLYLWQWLNCFEEMDNDGVYKAYEEESMWRTSIMSQ